MKLQHTLPPHEPAGSGEPEQYFKQPNPLHSFYLQPSLHQQR